MESLKKFLPLTGTVSATVITLSFLLLGVNSILNAKIDPIKKDIGRLEAGQARFERELKEIKADLTEIKRLLTQSHTKTAQNKKPISK